MRRAIILLSGLLAALPRSVSQSAPVSSNNPQGAQYIAPFSSPLSGSVVVSSLANGSVGIEVSISRLSSSRAPFWYTINTNPVSSNGSCVTTGPAFNPFNASGICNAGDPSRCPIGDLSGKHGMMPGPDFAANYFEPYLSTSSDSPAFVGNRSVVILNSNGTILACANFTMGGSSSSQSLGGNPGARLILTAASAVQAPSNMAPGPIVQSASLPISSSTIAAATQKEITTMVAPPPAPGGNLQQPSAVSASNDMTTALVPPAAPGGNLPEQPPSVPAPDKISTVIAPPAAPGGNLRQKSSSSPISTTTTPPMPAPAPGGNNAPSQASGLSDQVTSGPNIPAASSALSSNSSAMISPIPMSDGCNSTSVAASTLPAPPPVPPTSLTSTPGVISGFTPGLNGPAATVTTTMINTATIGGPTTTITQDSNNTVTVRIMVPANITSSSSSSPTPTPVCGTGVRTTLPNGQVATVLVPGSGGPVNATRPPSVIVTTMPGGPRVSTVSGGPDGTTVTLPRGSVTLWGMDLPSLGHRSRITIPPDSVTTITLPPDGSMTTITYTPFVTSSTPTSTPVSVRTITVPPSSTSVVTIPASPPPANVLTVVAGPVGTTVTLPNTIVAVPAGATSVVSPIANIVTELPTVSVLELLGGRHGVTTMVPEVSSVVTVPGGETSDITLPASTPGLDVMTLLGGVDGLTTEIPELPLETPGLLDLQTPDIVTDVLNPEVTNIVSGPPDTSSLFGAGTKLEVERVAPVGVACVLALVILIL